MPRAPRDWRRTIRRAKALARAGDPRALDLLLPALRWRYDTARNEAVATLAALGSLAQPRVLAVLRSAGTAVERRAAADALAAMRSTRAVPDLVRALRDPNMVVRRAAVRALAVMQVRDAVLRIAQLLQDESGGVRVLAAHALGALRDPAAVPGLIRALQDPKWYVRQAAAESLGELANPQAASALRRLSRDRRPAVARAARAALVACRRGTSIR